MFDWQNFIVNSIMFDWVQQSNDWCSIGFDCRTVRLDRSGLWHDRRSQKTVWSSGKLKVVKDCLLHVREIHNSKRKRKEKNTQLNSSKNPFYKLVKRTSRIIDLNALILIENKLKNDEKFICIQNIYKCQSNWNQWRTVQTKPPKKTWLNVT